MLSLNEQKFTFEKVHLHGDEELMKALQSSLLIWSELTRSRQKSVNKKIRNLILSQSPIVNYWVGLCELEILG